MAVRVFAILTVVSSVQMFVTCGNIIYLLPYLLSALRPHVCAWFKDIESN